MCMNFDSLGGKGAANHFREFADFQSPGSTGGFPAIASGMPEHTDIATDKDTSPPTRRVKKFDVGPPGAAHVRMVPNA